MERIRTDRATLVKFGYTMGTAFLVIAALIMLRHRHDPTAFQVLSVAFFCAGLLLPALLKPVYIVWMRFAFVLAFINTRLLLALMFYGIFTPAALLLKLMGKDFLDRKFPGNKPTYWIAKPEAPVQRGEYEHQF